MIGLGKLVLEIDALGGPLDLLAQQLLGLPVTPIGDVDVRLGEDIGLVRLALGAAEGGEDGRGGNGT